jgi:hypothetical protein
VLQEWWTYCVGAFPGSRASAGRETREDEAATRRVARPARKLTIDGKMSRGGGPVAPSWAAVACMLFRIGRRRSKVPTGFQIMLPLGEAFETSPLHERNSYRTPTAS